MINKLTGESVSERGEKGMTRIHSMLFCIVVVLLLVVPLETALGEVNFNSKRILTLEEAITTTLENNPALKNAQLDSERAEELKKDIEEYVKYIPQNVPINTPGVGELYANYQIADMNYQVSKRDIENLRKSIILDVHSKYCDVVKYEAQLVANKKAFQRDQIAHDINILRNKLGMATKSDLESSELQLHQSRSLMENTSHLLSMARNALNILMGISATDYTLVVPKWETIDIGPIETEISKALSSSSEVWKAGLAANVLENTKYLVSDWDLGKIDAEKALQGEAMARESIKKATNSLYWTLSGMDSRRDTLILAIENANNAVEIAKNSYQVGVGTKLDVIKAEAILESLKTQLVELDCQNDVYLNQFKVLTGRM